MKTGWGNKVGLALIRGLSKWPMSALFVLSDLLYPIVHHLIRYRLKVVRKNLRMAFPNLADKELKRIERRFYRYFCDLSVEIIKFPDFSEEEVRKRIKYKNIEIVESSLPGREFALCYLGHYGNWEWLVTLPLFLHDYGMCQIYHPMRNKVFDKWFCDNRARFGAVNIPMKQSLKRLMMLRNDVQSATPSCKGYLFGCIADQLPKKVNEHHRLTFLNQNTGVFTGSEKLGRMFGMSFFYVKVQRTRRGFYEVTFENMENVNPEISEFAYTEEYMRRFERDINECPELWLWTHDRWKR